MALAKSITFKGAALTYHKIGTISMDLMAGKTTVGLLSYVDQATCDADPSAFLNGQYLTVDGTPSSEAPQQLQSEQLQVKPLGIDQQVDPAPAPTDPIAWAYGQIQLLPDWTDATPT